MKRKNKDKNNLQVKRIKLPENEKKVEEKLESGDEDEGELNLGQLFRDKSKKKKSGGFQSMGFTYAILKGVLRKGYKVPTPIQRKTIPVILDGKDVVAMARTGSGKTAAFLLPLFQRLKTRCGKTGARALILSPTRELAQQTMKFAKELGKFTGLRYALVLGGDKMDDQFAAIHDNPDVLIATPGRFLHIVMEMDLKLSSVEYIVFDEADRLFEMGFQDQLLEILHRLPENRQTLLFSATLPRLMVDFAKAGLNDPVLIRLDTETKLSNQLKTAYLFCRSEDKFSILLHLLTQVIEKNQLTVVFFATKHHVEYAKDILEQAEIPCSYIYSSLDQTARKIQGAKFHARKTTVLLVTDVAARGIDIPHLDFVINFNFPAKPKLFVHRVGRVARAGRDGTAFSIVSPDETAYVLDLHLFLGRPLAIAAKTKTDSQDGVIGSVPQSVIDEESDALTLWHNNHIELKSMAKVCSNGYEQYLKSRPAPSNESTKRMKEILNSPVGIHPMFKNKTATAQLEDERTKFLENMKSYRPLNTIFEVGATAKSQAPLVMRVKKEYHRKAIEKTRNTHKLQNETEDEDLRKSFMKKLPLMDNEDDIKNSFSNVMAPKSQRKRQNQDVSFKDKNFYLNYKPIDHHSEKGFEIEKSSFNKQVNKEILDLNGDESTQIAQSSGNKKWDRKKKKFVNDPAFENKRKKIRTESGVLIPATYKSNAYNQWKEKNKVDQQEHLSDSEDEGRKFGGRLGNNRRGGKKRDKDEPGAKSGKGRHFKRELKTKDEILKMRNRRERLEGHRKKVQGGRIKKKKMLKREKFTK